MVKLDNVALHRMGRSEMNWYGIRWNNRLMNNQRTGKAAYWDFIRLYAEGHNAKQLNTVESWERSRKGKKERERER